MTSTAATRQVSARSLSRGASTAITIVVLAGPVAFELPLLHANAFVPNRIFRSLIAQNARADGSPLRRLHHCRNQKMLWRPAKANMSIHATLHAALLLHMQPHSRWDSLRCRRGLWHGRTSCSESPRYRNITCRGNIGLAVDVRSS